MSHTHRKPFIDVCLSPALYHLYDPSQSIVVVIDILRATSSICVAFEYGAECLIPVATVEESLSYKQKGYLVGAERKGEMLQGFDFGNSPFSYMDSKIRGSKIALTTTNGTRALTIAKNAHTVAVGSFLNLHALCKWLRQQQRDVICLCSGWKNSVNLEDTLFAGAVVNELLGDFDLSDFRDTAVAAQQLYLFAKDDMYGYLDKSSHRKRLEKLNIEEDIIYCLKPDQTNVVPVLQDNVLVPLKKTSDVIDSVL